CGGACSSGRCERAGQQNSCSHDHDDVTALRLAHAPGLLSRTTFPRRVRIPLNEHGACHRAGIGKYVMSAAFGRGGCELTAGSLVLGTGKTYTSPCIRFRSLTRRPEGPRLAAGDGAQIDFGEARPVKWLSRP